MLPQKLYASEIKMYIFLKKEKEREYESVIKDDVYH